MMNTAANANSSASTSQIINCMTVVTDSPAENRITRAYIRDRFRGPETGEEMPDVMSKRTYLRAPCYSARFYCQEKTCRELDICFLRAVTFLNSSERKKLI